MKKMLLFHPEKCTGCNTCELACSLVQTGVCNPGSSRRRNVHFEETVLDVPMQCQQCEDAACMNTCPAQAIVLDESTGAKILNEKKCIGCRMCMIACPFGAISMDPLTKKVVKCDLCSGDPACAQWCPTGAIEYVTPRSYDLIRQRARLDAIEKKGILGGR